MSRFDVYNNEFDEDDDGEDLEITEEEAAASDDDGREQAALLKAHSESIAGNRKVHEDQRRMWFRMAKQALAEGAERREAVEEQERAEREQEEAAERARVKAERAARHDRELIERADRDAAVRLKNAESARIEAETAWMAAQARPVAKSVVVASPPSVPLMAPPRVVPPPQPQRASPSPPRPMTPGPATWSPPQPTVLRPTRSEQPAARLAPARQPGPPPAPASVPRYAPRRQREVQPAYQVPAARSPISSPAPSVRPPPVRVVAAPPRSPAVPAPGLLTGADLARWRTRRGITQRGAAEELGVAPSTVAKAELVPSRPLGEQLRVGLAAALAR